MTMSTEPNANMVVEQTNGDVAPQGKMEVEESAAGATDAAKKNPGTEIFVGSIPKYIKASTLYEKFNQFGSVKKCIVRRFFAFVSMDTVENAKKAIENLNGTELNKRKITVELAGGPREKPATPTGPCHICGEVGHYRRQCPQAPPRPNKRKLDSESTGPRKKMFKFKRRQGSDSVTAPALLGQCVREKLDYSCAANEDGEGFVCTVTVLGETFKGEDATKKKAKAKAAGMALRILVSKKDNVVWETLAKRAGVVPSGEQVDEKAQDESVLKLIEAAEAAPSHPPVQYQASMAPINPMTFGIQKSIPDIGSMNPASLLRQLVPDVAFEVKAETSNPVSFTADVTVNGVLYTGTGFTKKDAQAHAARNAMKGEIANKSSSVYQKLGRMVKAEAVEEEQLLVLLGLAAPKDAPGFASASVAAAPAPVVMPFPQQMVARIPEGKRVVPIHPKALIKRIMPTLKFNDSMEMEGKTRKYISVIELDGVFYRGEGSTKKLSHYNAATMALKAKIAEPGCEIYQQLAKIATSTPKGKVPPPVDQDTLLALIQKPVTATNTSVFHPVLTSLSANNARTLLAELKPGVVYTSMGFGGPSPAQVYAVEVTVNDVTYTGKGTSRLDAEEDAARRALRSQICDPASDIYQKMARLATGVHVGGVPPVAASQLVSLIPPPSNTLMPSPVVLPPTPVPGSFASVRKPPVKTTNSHPVALLHSLFRNSPPVFTDLGNIDPTRPKIFSMEVEIKGQKYRGEATTKKAAKMDAARKALIGLHDTGVIKASDVPTFEFPAVATSKPTSEIASSAVASQSTAPPNQAKTASVQPAQPTSTPSPAAPWPTTAAPSKAVTSFTRSATTTPQQMTAAKQATSLSQQDISMKQASSNQQMPVSRQQTVSFPHGKQQATGVSQASSTSSSVRPSPYARPQQPTSSSMTPHYGGGSVSQSATSTQPKQSYSTSIPQQGTNVRPSYPTGQYSTTTVRKPFIASQQSVASARQQQSATAVRQQQQPGMTQQQSATAVRQQQQPGMTQQQSATSVRQQQQPGMATQQSATAVRQQQPNMASQTQARPTGATPPSTTSVSKAAAPSQKSTVISQPPKLAVQPSGGVSDGPSLTGDYGSGQLWGGQMQQYGGMYGPGVTYPPNWQAYKRGGYYSY